MKRIILGLFILLVTSPAFSLSIEDTTNEVKSVSVTIQSEMCSESHNICTGVIISNQDDVSVVLTARHCVMKSKMYVENLPVIGAIISQNEDLALLFLKEKIPNKSEVKLSTTAPRVGEEVVAFGYPRGKAYYRVGQLISLKYDTLISNCGNFLNLERNLFHTNISIIGGCSGGGLFNSKAELIGINVNGLPNNSNAVNFSALINFVATAHKLQRSL